MKAEFDLAAIERVIAAIADELEGDWLLIGGALTALWLEPRRVTEDLDVIGIGGNPAARLRLMELAVKLGLPIESVNSAADYFVFRIDGWERELELFRQGRRGRILRPTPTLFLLLKVRRLSERDLADCLAAVRHARAYGLTLDGARIKAELLSLGETQDESLQKRRGDLLTALDSGVRP